MRLRRLWPAALIPLAALIWFHVDRSPLPAPAPGELDPPRSKKEVHAGKLPSDWFLRQRAWPQDDVNQRHRLEAAAQARQMREEARLEAARARTVAPEWAPLGPTNISGRISDLACHPTNPAVAYIGAASGGVWKTTDTGGSWAPLFDDEATLSIGSVAVDPQNPQIVWAGTGEPNGGGGSVTYGGVGVLKSTDGGDTWAHVGLEDTRYIGRVVVDPTNSNRVYVAALGAMWSTNPERGVYRTTDGGDSWELVHYLADDTGAIDLVIDPSDPDRLFAAMWERTRGPNFLNYGGDGSGIWRSTDGGSSWSELTTGLPAGPSVGRIGLAISQSSPNTLYSIYAEASPGAFVGVYKSTNGGNTWAGTNDSSLSSMYSSFGWWFGNIRVAPTDPNRVFVLGLTFHRTTNGGSSWSDTGSSMHVDHHALDFAADGSIWEGNDGGVYRSTNGGTAWSEFDNLPITQFYTVEVDEQFPLRRYGGTQDNGTNRTLTGNADDWSSIYGGDGFRCLVDPTNNQYVYATYQYGGLGRSTNGGASFSWGATGLNGRKNWSMPYQFNPDDPSELYAGTDRVYRSTNRAQSWTAISADLTDGNGGLNGYTFGTITALEIAPSDPDVILIGTDDANVWITTNGGSNWLRRDATLPERWVTRTAFDPDDASICYVTFSGFRYDDYQPHVFRSTDYGATWADISGNLPQAPVNDIVVDPQFPDQLYVATDFGAYHSFDLGGTWDLMSPNLPNVVVTDLELHQPSRVLIAATYGRSLWLWDLSTIVGVGEGPLALAGDTPQLHAPAPNPARAGDVRLSWSQPRAADVRLDVYDVTGRRVVRLADKAMTAGDHAVTWTGRNDAGDRVAPGVYLVRFTGDGVVRTTKVTLTR